MGFYFGTEFVIFKILVWSGAELVNVDIFNFTVSKFPFSKSITDLVRKI